MKVLSKGRSSSEFSPATLPALAPVAVLAAEEAGGSASMMLEGAMAGEAEDAAAMALALAELLLMPAPAAGQAGARRAAAAPQAPVAHGCGGGCRPAASAAAAVLARRPAAAAATREEAERVTRPSSEGAPAAISCSGVASQRACPFLQLVGTSHGGMGGAEARGFGPGGMPRAGTGLPLAAGQVGGGGGAAGGDQVQEIAAGRC